MEVAEQNGGDPERGVEDMINLRYVFSVMWGRGRHQTKWW